MSSRSQVSRRQVVTFAMIAMLLFVFAAIAFWGLVESDWLYGTFGGISQSQWERITQVRDRLARLDLASEAVAILDDALLRPHPADEHVLVDLRRAARALDPYATDAEVRRIQADLYVLIAEIQPDSAATPTPWPTLTPRPSPTLTPIVDAPVAWRDAP